MPKITIIGGGAYVFPLVMSRDILARKALRDSTICLYDIHAGRNNVNAAGVRRMIEMARLPARCQATTDRKRALAGADFCVCTFQVGGIEAYGHDVNIPRKYGIDQCVGDSFGPGGIFRGMRSIRALQRIAADMHRLCPEALFLQYANPMAINSWAMSLLDIVNAGLCHSVQGTSRMLAAEMHLPYERCSFVSAGINHQAWFIEFRCDGIDVMPLLRKTMLAKHLAAAGRGRPGDELHAGGRERVRTEIMQLTGYFQTESSAHASEYLAYFRKQPGMVLEYQPRRWDYYQICSAHAEAKQRVADFLKEVKRDGLVASEEYGSGIIDSVVTGELRLVHASVPNDGIITNLPCDCSVEVPVFVDRQGLRPQVIGDLPPACAAVNRLTVNQVQLAVEAALRGDRDLLYAAVAMDPLTAALLTLPKIRKMVDEMIRAEQRWLPKFTSRTLITAGAAQIAGELATAPKRRKAPKRSPAKARKN